MKENYALTYSSNEVKAEISKIEKKITAGFGTQADMDELSELKGALRIIEAMGLGPDTSFLGFGGKK